MQYILLVYIALCALMWYMCKIMHKNCISIAQQHSNNKYTSEKKRI